MSDNYSLIIKNGSCYIDGKLEKTDLGLSGKKIKKMLNTVSIKDIVDLIVKEKNISKKEIYNYCLSLKNENKIY